MKKLFFTWILLLGFALSSFSQVKVYVSLAPQAYLIKRIGGVQVEVLPLVQTGESEEAYQLTPQQRKALGEADLYYYMHLPFEKALMERLAAENATRTKPLRMIDSCEGMNFLMMESACSCHGGHHHSLQDPHVWLDPKNMSIMAGNMAKTLADFDPLFASVYQKNAADLQADLASLHAELNDLLTPFRGYPLLVFHPSYGYFAKAYGLKQIPIEKDGKEPLVKDLSDLVEHIKKLQDSKNPPKAIFVQPNFSTRTAETLAKSLNLKVVELDPLSEDYLNGMRRLTEQIISAWKAPQ